MNKILMNWADGALFDDPPSGPAGGASPAAGGGTPPAGAGTPPANGGVGGTPPAGAPPAAAPGAPAAGTPPAGSPPAGTPPAAGDLYRPQGLPETLLGATNNETIDKMAAQLKTFTDRAGQVPETPDGYKQFGQVDAAIKPHIDMLASDPLFDRITAKALERGIPTGDFQNLTVDLYTLATEMGVLEAPINVEAERAKLTPDSAKHLPPAEQKTARERRMNDNYAFMDTLAAPPGQQGGISKEAIDYVKSQIGDTDHGHKFIEHMRAQLTAGSRGPLITGAAPGALDPKAEISRRQALPENTWGDAKFDRASYDQLQKDARTVYGGQ